MASKKCINCEYARQIGGLKRTDVVGCQKILESKVLIDEVKTKEPIVEGWIYPYRRPGRSGLYKHLDEARIEFSSWVSAEAKCKMFSKIKPKGLIIQ